MDPPGSSWNGEMVIVNVSGTKFHIPVHRHPPEPTSSRLARFVAAGHEERIQLCDCYLPIFQEYFFARSARLFEAIYDLHISGQLHRPRDFCEERWRKELEFWEIPEAETCFYCCDNLADSSVIDNNETESSHGEQNEILLNSKSEDFHHLPWGRVRRRLWRLWEEPGTSLDGKIVALISVLFIVASVAALILASVPEFQSRNGEPIEALEYVEYACISWFSIEYALRFLVAPCKLTFLKSFLNGVDLMTVLPFYLELALSHVGVAEGMVGFRGLMQVMRILRVLRVARVFKLARYSSGLQSFGETVRGSRAELGMLALFLVTAIIFYSTLIYYFEKDAGSANFRSIPDSCWWCIITMTTVGYGDVVPYTIGGKIVASIASISGVLVLAFPITMIVDNFARHYHKEEIQAGTRPRRRIGKFS